MQVLLILVGLAGMVYVVASRRRFDLLSVAFFAACVYFAPGFLGFAAYPAGLLLVPVPLTTAAYLVMTMLLASNLAFLVAVDLIRRPQPAMQPYPKTAWPWEAWIATGLGVAGAAITVLSVGPELLAPDKVKVMEMLGRGHILWATGATVGFVAAFVAGSRIAMAINGALLLANLFIGFRVEMVIALITVAYLLLAGPQQVRLIERWRLVGGVLVFGFTMIAIKYFLAAIKLADIDLLLALAANADAWRLMFANSEPFITQGILNEVFVTDFRIDASQLADALYLLVPFSENLGAEVRSFNAAFQPTLFSSVTDYGLANNFWAQMWSAGGWGLLVLAVFGYHVTLVWLDGLCKRVSPSWRPVFAIAGIYLAFYIHRNDLVYQLTLERRVFVFGVVVVLASIMCRSVARSATSRKRRVGGDLAREGVRE